MNKLTDFQDFVMEANARVADQDWRLGQALMNVLPDELQEKYSGGKFDCFYDDSLVGHFLNEVYNDFQPKTVEVVIWSKEPRWYKRHVILDCSITDTKGMTSGELEERIIEFIDVLDVEECDDYAVDFDIENIEAI
jgi:hypothetical protein